MDNEKLENDEISLIDLFAVLFKYKWMIIIITICAAVFIVIYSVLSLKLPPEKSFLPNQYTSEALMLINDSARSSGISQALSASGLGNMAALMGIKTGGSGQSYSKLAIFLAGSNSFLDSVVEKFNIKDRYKITQKIKTNTRNAVLERVKVAFDETTGVFSIACRDIDPEFARDVVLFCVDYYEQRFLDLGLDKDRIEKANIESAMKKSMLEIENLLQQIHNLDSSSGQSYALPVSEIVFKAEKLKLELEGQKKIYAELKAKFELLKIKMSSETPILQVLELPEVPEQKSAPSRGKLCIIVTFAAFFISIFLAFLLNAIKNIKNDKKAMAKLKGQSYEKK